MKKSVLVFVVAALVLATVGLWIFSGLATLKPMDLVSFGVIIIIVAFAVFIGFKRLNSARRGEPAEDELSKKVMQKTASMSYYISLYWWLVLMYFTDKLNYETHTYIAAGILGMAVIFAICWLVFNLRGFRNE
jgi:peptidoglycan/LPS O-acetylase OafA/YrhL